MSSISKNEECFLKILRSQSNPLRTSEILNLAELFPKLCSGCKSGTDVISAGVRLLKKQMIQRTVGKGGFLWSLV
ncbi:MAG: hypothetical protein ACW99A_14275 [Candidatus Kariarchaeaceae archaeon]